MQLIAQHRLLECYINKAQPKAADMRMCPVRHLHSTLAALARRRPGRLRACSGVMSSYGTRPVSSSHSMMPKLNTSARSRYGLCSITSGAIHLPKQLRGSGSCDADPPAQSARYALQARFAPCATQAAWERAQTRSSSSGTRALLEIGWWIAPIKLCLVTNPIIQHRAVRQDSVKFGANKPQIPKP